MSEALPAGRAILGLMPAAAAVVREWGLYVGSGNRAGHDDAERVGQAVRRLRDALAESGAPAHRIEMYTEIGTAATLAARLAKAVNYARHDGEPTVITMGGRRAALLIPAARARASVTAGLVREMADAGPGTVISRDQGGSYRAEARTAAERGGREVITGAADLAAWLGRDLLTDEDCGRFAASVTRELAGRAET